MKGISATSEQCLLVDFVKCKKKEWLRVSSKVSDSLCLGSASSFWQEYQSVCAGGLTLPSPRPSKTNRAMPMTQPCTWTPRLPTIAHTLTDYGSLEPRLSLIRFCASVFEQCPSFTIVDVLQLHGVISAEALRQEVCLFHDTESNPWNVNCQHNPVCVSWCHGRWECLPITQSCEFDALIPRTCVNCKQLASAHLSRFLSVAHPPLFLSFSLAWVRINHNTYTDYGAKFTAPPSFHTKLPPTVQLVTVVSSGTFIYSNINCDIFWSIHSSVIF